MNAKLVKSKNPRNKVEASFWIPETTSFNFRVAKWLFSPINIFMSRGDKLVCFFNHIFNFGTAVNKQYIYPARSLNSTFSSITFVTWALGFDKSTVRCTVRVSKSINSSQSSPFSLREQRWALVLFYAQPFGCRETVRKNESNFA